MGMWELAVILIVGLVVLGPERLPVAVRTVSRWIKSIKSLANSVKAEVNEELRTHELHQNLKKAEQKNMEDLTPDLKSSLDELKSAADSVTRSYQKQSHEVEKKTNTDEEK